MLKDAIHGHNSIGFGFHFPLSSSKPKLLTFSLYLWMFHSSFAWLFVEKIQLHFVVGRVLPAMVEREKFDHIEERLRAIDRDYAFDDMTELCLVPDVVIPPKFKMPDFNKYKGTTCPKNHLKMYCKKMGAYVKDEKLLMHFFQESLTGATVT